MIRIAVVGAGYIGRLHAVILHREFSKASVVAVVDKEEEKGRKLASDVDAVYYSDFDQMLEREECSVVAICTPTLLHADMVLQSAESGKSIFCEKPLAPTGNDVLRMIAAIKKHKVTAMAGHVLRFWPVYVKTKEMISSGILGKPRHCYCERLLTIPAYTEDEWNRDPDLGGVAFDVQIHDLDFMLWLFGKPLRVVSNGVYDEHFGGWLHIQSSIEFENNIVGSAQAGWGFPTQFPFTMGFRIVCENGTIEWSFRAGKLLEERSTDAGLVVYEKSGSAYRVDVDNTDAFLLEWRYFLDCIENKKSIDNATFEDGKNAVELARATMKSASENIPVELD
jgi:predicted dehydrogenase